MPGGKFSLEKSQNSEALAAAAGSTGMGYPVPNPPPGGQDANDILALLKGGKIDPQALMALLAMLAGMGPQGPAGMGQEGVPQQGAAPSPIAQAYGG